MEEPSGGLTTFPRSFLLSLNDAHWHEAAILRIAALVFGASSYDAELSLYLDLLAELGNQTPNIDAELQVGDASVIGA